MCFRCPNVKSLSSHSLCLSLSACLLESSFPKMRHPLQSFLPHTKSQLKHIQHTSFPFPQVSIANSSGDLLHPPRAPMSLVALRADRWNPMRWRRGDVGTNLNTCDIWECHLGRSMTILETIAGQKLIWNGMECFFGCSIISYLTAPKGNVSATCSNQIVKHSWIQEGIIPSLKHPQTNTWKCMVGILVSSCFI